MLREKQKKRLSTHTFRKTLYQSPDDPTIENKEIKRLVEKKLGIDVFVMNDRRIRYMNRFNGLLKYQNLRMSKDGFGPGKRCSPESPIFWGI